jgi:hypothetical protein
MRYHNGTWTIKARYGWRTFTPPDQIGDPQYAEVSISVNFANLLLQPDGTNPVVLAWDPDDPTKRQTRVKMDLSESQRIQGAVQLKVYLLNDPAQNRPPLKTVTVPVTMPATLVEIEWDGTNDAGTVMERGVYAYDLVATEDIPFSLNDNDKKTSDSLFIDAGTDEQGNPILEAEYAGYDNGGTEEDESDDNHLYYIRRYKLREVPVPLDNDGDGWENEDPVNGVDDDGDGAVDEDAVDYQALRGASEGYIRLYYVDELQKLAEWTIPSLLCVDHNTNDGLTTSTAGLQHSVLVKVPVALMDKAGEYRFVISAKDSHADREKGHRQKWALERNQTREEVPIVYINGTYAGAAWHGAWCRMPKEVGKRTEYFDPAPVNAAVKWVLDNTQNKQIRAAVNGGFFNLNQPEEVLGHVGEAKGNWVGNRPKERKWAFGMNGFSTDFRVEEMQFNGTEYVLSSTMINGYEAGLSGIGCLIRAGTAKSGAAADQGKDWPDYATNRGRTAVGWTGDKRHFFLIVTPDVQGGGWTWNETRDFFTTGLPAYMQQTRKVTISINDAMMLDGGGSTSFKYRWKDASGNPVQGGDPPPVNTTREIPDIVHVWAKSPK